MQSLEVNRTLLRIDGSWQLEELSDATRYYLRIYGFAYSLLPGLPTDQESKIRQQCRLSGREPFHLKQLHRMARRASRPNSAGVWWRASGKVHGYSMCIDRS